MFYTRQPQVVTFFRNPSPEGFCHFSLWPLSKELKSIELNSGERKSIAIKLGHLAQRAEHPVQLLAVVAEKAQVNLALRRRGESFYAHLAEQMLHQAVAPYLCSIVWSHFEYQNSEAFDLVKPHLRLQKLF